jgi:hypothetical protein
MRDHDMYAVLLFALFACGAASADLEQNGPACSAAARGRSLCEYQSDLCQRRAELADDLRATRKRSVVPILLSVLWFCAAMAISFSRAFRIVDSSAFDLSLSLLMSWLQGLVACGVVDRYPTSSLHIRRALQ